MGQENYPHQEKEQAAEQVLSEQQRSGIERKRRQARAKLKVSSLLCFC
jgi:hypothetical protein